MRKSSWLMLAVGLLAASMAGCSTSDRVRLQGHWTGQEVGREGSMCRLIITKSNIEFRGDREMDWYKATFTLDEEAEPRQLNGVIEECAAPKYVGKTSRAIYKLEDTTLTLAGNEPGHEQRPTSFDAAGRARVFMFTKDK
jgi:uncharacterized protein (TIGR03067 family)